MGTIKELFEIIDSLHDVLVSVGNIPIDGIKKIETILGCDFPEDYRLFLNRYGAISAGSVTIFGISFPVDCKPSIVWALKDLWKEYPDFPQNLIPIQQQDASGDIICIECSNSEMDAGSRASLFRFTPSLEEENIISLDQDFIEYMSNVFMDVKYRRDAYTALEEHVSNFEREYLSKDKQPRNFIWRPYRFCSQDVILGLTVVRHSIDNNCLEVDVCLTTDVPEFEEGIGAKITTAFLLSEAYKCGGSMEIRFSKKVEGGRVPAAIRELAKRHGVTLSHSEESRITPSEARLLYLAISEFSRPLENLIISLAGEERLSIERPCYALYHGLWTQDQIENIMLGSPYPESILGGEASPEQRHHFLEDLSCASTAVMGGVIDRKLAKRERNNGAEALELEDDVKPVSVAFNSDYCAKVYSCEEEISIPWMKGRAEQLVKSGSQVIVLLRAYSSQDMERFLSEDIHIAGSLINRTLETGEISHSYILVPRDFEELPQKAQNDFISSADISGVGILVCPETITALKTNAAKNMASGRIMRE